MTSLPRLEGVLGAAVRAPEHRLATVTGAVFDARWERLLGLEATGRDGVRRFLPWVAVELHDGVVAVMSPFVLVDTRELDGYVRLGAMVVRDPMQLAGLGVGSGGEITSADTLAGVSQEVGGYRDRVRSPRDETTANSSARPGGCPPAERVLCRGVSRTASPFDQRPHARA